MRWATGLGVIALLTAPCSLLSAQVPDLERERREYSRWLASAPTSPLGAIAFAPVSRGIDLGTGESDIPLDGLPLHRVTEQGGRVTLSGLHGNRSLVRGRPVAIGGYTLLVGGSPGRTTLAVHRTPPADAKPPSWYDPDPSAAFVVSLTPPSRPASVRVLAAEGTEVEAAEAGTVTLTVGGARTTLLVRRMPGATPEESELEVYFRDRTNGKGTYPAGRFVALVPIEDGRYRLDFNRARNPFCAYSSVYPCPAPWRGNSIPVPIEAGERYAGGGLDPGVSETEQTGVSGER
jgi:uncharacterized protein